MPADLFALAVEAGGVGRLEGWFTVQWADPVVAREEWGSYLDGQYELDRLEPAFTAYDRLRFHGPTSRDTCIDAMRLRFPRSDPG